MFLNVIEVMSSHTNIDCLRFWLSVFFFCWKNPGGSVRKTVKLTDHVHFVYQALFI